MHGSSLGHGQGSRYVVAADGPDLALVQSQAPEPGQELLDHPVEASAAVSLEGAAGADVAADHDLIEEACVDQRAHAVGAHVVTGVAVTAIADVVDAQV